MESLLNTIKKILIFILLLGTITAGIDYLRMKSGELPIFNIKKYNDKQQIETFRGLFYIGERTIKRDKNEPLIDSYNMKYSFLIFDLDVPKKFKEQSFDYKLEIEEKSSCEEKEELYYNNSNYKIYTRCINSIKVAKDDNEELNNYLEKDKTIINDIINKLGYVGTYKNSNILMFTSRLDDSFTNKDITIYKCDEENNTFYITLSNSEFNENFCRK